MNDTNTSHELTDVNSLTASHANDDFLTLLADIQTNTMQETTDSAPTDDEAIVQKRRLHHLWHRRGEKATQEPPRFTPVPSAETKPTFGVFDTDDGQIFDTTMRLRLHTLVATCLMNGIVDQRVNAFLHLLQWPNEPQAIVIAGTYRQKTVKESGPTRHAKVQEQPHNTDTLRRTIWPMLGACQAYDAIVDRVQTNCLPNTTPWRTPGTIGNNNAPTHIIILALRGEAHAQALEKITQLLTPSGRPVCVSNMVSGVEQIATAITSTLAALAVADGVVQLPQIIHANDVLPERALIGDQTAIETLYKDVYQSLVSENHDDPTLDTVDMFLRFGGALDQTSHELNVHPNTVRYRLRKVAQTTGWDATNPREAYVLRTAIAIGRIRDAGTTKAYKQSPTL